MLSRILFTKHHSKQPKEDKMLCSTIFVPDDYQDLFYGYQSIN